MEHARGMRGRITAGGAAVKNIFQALKMSFFVLTAGAFSFLEWWGWLLLGHKNLPPKITAYLV